MEPLAILHADPLDLLFENRNKSYGAYSLRKYYPQRLLISLGITSSLVVISSFACLYFQTPPVYARIIEIPDPHIQTLEFPEDIKPVHPPTRPSAARPPASVQNVTPVIVASQTTTKPLPTAEDLRLNAIGIKTSAGDAGDGQPSIHVSNPPGAATQGGDSVESKPAILERAEVMPEFPGGIQALMRFLSKNLRMPENNLQAGTEIQVMARFVVAADGRVGDVEIVQAADAVFNAEVKRVIAKMPDWKPGSQNHRHVAVYFSLPVHFVTAE